MDKAELNENLTNLQIEHFNKTGLGNSTTGATTATCASYKLLAQLTTWNKMAAYDDTAAKPVTRQYKLYTIGHI